MTLARHHAEKEEELKKRMRQLKIYSKDIQETFVRSSKPGGQNVNKVSTCVVLLHIPTRIKVRCQEERTQSLNRFKALRILVDKVERQIKYENAKATQAAEKKRRQNRKRPKALKESILEDKHKQAEKKKKRKAVDPRRVETYY